MMNNVFSLLIKKQTDMLIQQTQTRPQETFDFRMNKQEQAFPFNPPINLVEEGERLLAVTSFEATNSVFNTTRGNNSFSICILGHWNYEVGEELINKLDKLLELTSENDIEFYVKEVGKKGTRIKIEDVGFNLAGFDYFKSEILSELKTLK